ncbi:hypothetical protein V1522DRAFT_454175 [Lipomyces starkeyi]
MSGGLHKRPVSPAHRSADKIELEGAYDERQGGRLPLSVKILLFIVGVTGTLVIQGQAYYGLRDQAKDSESGLNVPHSTTSELVTMATGHTADLAKRACAINTVQLAGSIYAAMLACRDAGNPNNNRRKAWLINIIVSISIALSTVRSAGNDAGVWYREEYAITWIKLGKMKEFNNLWNRSSNPDVYLVTQGHTLFGKRMATVVDATRMNLMGMQLWLASIVTDRGLAHL